MNKEIMLLNHAYMNILKASHDIQCNDDFFLSAFANVTNTSFLQKAHSYTNIYLTEIMVKEEEVVRQSYLECVKTLKRVIIIINCFYLNGISKYNSGGIVTAIQT